MSWIKITSCNLPIRWYNKHIGEYFPLRRIAENPLEYETREPEGYINYVQPEDCVIVDSIGDVTNDRG